MEFVFDPTDQPLQSNFPLLPVIQSSNVPTLEFTQDEKLTIFCRDHFEEVMDRMVEGETLKNILDSIPDAPSTFGFLTTIKTSPTMMRRFEDAKESMAFVMEDHVLQIADGTHDGPPMETTRAKLMIDTRFRLMETHNQKFRKATQQSPQTAIQVVVQR